MSEAALKLDQNQEDKQFAIFDCEVKAAKENDRVLRFIGTTEAKDRYGDVISVKGWQLKNYKKNPVFLWAHNYNELPIGKVLKIEKGDGALYFDVEFAGAEVNPKAEFVFQAYKQGFLKATSVGFRSLKHEDLAETDDEKAERMKKEPDSQNGWRFLKQELLELSAVPVPANPEALMVARQKGVKMPEALEIVLDKYFKDARDKIKQQPDGESSDPTTDEQTDDVIADGADAGVPQDVVAPEEASQPSDDIVETDMEDDEEDYIEIVDE